MPYGAHWPALRLSGRTVGVFYCEIEVVLVVLVELGSVINIIGSVMMSALALRPTVLFLPLDERFATRGLTLNLGHIAPAYDILTPPEELISFRKIPADPRQLQEWVEGRVGSAHALLASVEMLVYGGLIASRCCNDSSALISERVHWLGGLAARFPRLRLYLSSVVVRVVRIERTSACHCLPTGVQCVTDEDPVLQL